MRGFFSDRHRPASERGFTLTELLVAMGILAVLSSIAIPVILSQQGKADRAALEADLSTAFEQMELAYREGRSVDPNLNMNSPYTFSYTGSTPDNFCVQVTVPDKDSTLTLHKTAAGFGEGPCEDPLVYPDTVFTLGSNQEMVRPAVGSGIEPAGWSVDGTLPPGFSFVDTPGTDGGSFVGPTAAGWGWQAIALAAGDSHACVVTSANEIRCWGSNTYGQLGIGSQDDSSATAQLVSWLNNASKITAGAQHTCAIADGGAYCWGRNNFGQVGNNSTETVTIPSSAGSLNATDIAAGAQHTCAIADGDVYCWGRNTEGQVGATSSTTPLQVSGLAVTAPVAVYAGGDLSCTLDSTGSLYCWGDLDGQAAPGPGTPFATGVTSAAVGAHHLCVLDTAGEVYCWGSNDDYQLGSTGPSLTSKPSTPVQGLPASVEQITAGDNHTCAVAAGDLYCWGSNEAGQTGNVDTAGVLQATPSAVPGLADPNPAAAGDSFTCSVVSGGKVECWGDGAAGQLGNGPEAGTGVEIAATPYCADGGTPTEDVATGEWRCVTGQQTVWSCPSGSEPDYGFSPPRCLTVDPIPAEYTCPDGGTVNNTTGECTKPGTTWSYSAVTGYATSTYAATATTTQSIYSYTCPSGGVLNGTTCYVTTTSSPTYSYYCSPDPGKTNLRLVGTSCYWDVWTCPSGWNKIDGSLCASTNYPERVSGLCSDIQPKPNTWIDWRYNAALTRCEANIVSYNATLSQRIEPADYGMNCGSGTLVGGQCQTTTTYPATYASVYSCPSGGTVTSTSPPTCTREDITGYYCDAAGNGYSPSLVEEYYGTTPMSCRWYAWSCSAGDRAAAGVDVATSGNIPKPEPVSQWSCGSNYETSPSHCARSCTNSSSGSTAGQWCSNIASTYCSGGSWSCSNNTSYSCPGGWTLSGTQCYRDVTTVAQSGYSGTSSSTCSALRGGCLSASWSCSWTPGTTSCVAAGSQGSLCSSISPKPSSWCSWYSSGGRCYYSTNQTSAGYSTYNCPTSYTTTRQWQAASSSNTAVWSCTKYQTVTGPGVKVLRGGFASTPITSTSTYPATGDPVNITTYSCPSGGSLSGTTCTYTTSYLYCPHGGSLSGAACFITDPPTTYPGTLVDGTGTPGFVQDATDSLEDIFDPALWTDGREYWVTPTSVAGSGALQGMPATVTVTMTDAAGNTYQRTVTLTLRESF